MCAKFGEDQLRGLGVAWAEQLGFTAGGKKMGDAYR